MRIRTKHITSAVLALACLLFAVPVGAQEVATVAAEAGLSSTPLPIIIGRIIAVGLAFVGVILLVIVLYAGFLWMTAGGNGDQIDRAKKLITNGVVGLVIILSSYAITTFVVRALTDGVGIFSGGDGSGGSGVSIEPYSGSYGYGIRDHYPGRGQVDVPRNARIFITFSEAMDPSGFLSGEGSNALNTNNIKIYRNVDGEDGALDSEEVAVQFTSDFKTVTFTPPTLGSSTENTQYTVFLSDNLRTEEGERIIRDNGYSWFFTVGTFFDNTPPTVTRVVPRAGETYAKNILVEVHFSEPIDPTSASGRSSIDSSLQMLNGDQPVDGSFVLTNNYQTVTFAPDAICGTNTCGDTVYCLPGGATITALVKAAEVGENPPLAVAAEALSAFDGIVDNVGNSLDGNGDGAAGDNYSWSFNTTNDLQISAPVIESITPSIGQSNVPLDAPINVGFNTEMSVRSISSETVDLPSSPEHSLWYNTFVSTEDDGTSTLRIQHGVFLKSTVDVQYSYGVSVTSGVTDIYQNCFNPADGPGASGETCETSAAEPYCCNGVAQSNACALF